jgi:MFS family permease
LPKEAAGLAEVDMTREQRRGWLIVGALFVVELLVLGGVTGTMGLFLTPLMKQFGWSHSRVSMIPTAFSLAFGLGTPLVGWLMDRIDARFTMSVGAALAGLGLLVASQTSSFGIFLAAFLAVGVGTCASTFVPAAIVVANWFTDNRGFATGAAMMGSSVGGIVMPLLAAYLIAARGVSFTYEVLGTMALLNIISLFAIVRTRPGDNHSPISESAESLPGLEVGQALRTSSFWILALIQALVLGAESGVFFHLGPFLAGAGFTPQQTAIV